MSSTTVRHGRRPRLRLPTGTARLVLREFGAADEAALVAWCCDRRVTRHMPFGPRDAEAARRHLANLLRQQSSASRGTWEMAVTLAGVDEAIGACEISLTSRTTAEIGYVLARRHWGQGYATELARALVRLAFEDLAVGRVDSTVDVANTRSAQVLEKAGLRWEGTQRRHARAQGRWWDAHVYSLNRDDWILAQPSALAPADARPTSSPRKR